MKNRWLALGAFAVLVLLALAYRHLFPNDERIIRHQFSQLARVASVPPNESPLARLAKAQRVARFFASDAVLTIASHGVGTVEGRDQLLTMVVTARANLSQARFQIPDVQVVLDPDRQSAAVDLTALAEINGDKSVEVLEFRGSLRKQDGRWLITRLDPVKNFGQ